MFGGVLVLSHVSKSVTVSAAASGGCVTDGEVLSKEEQLAVLETQIDLEKTARTGRATPLWVMLVVAARDRVTACPYTGTYVHDRTPRRRRRCVGGRCG